MNEDDARLELFHRLGDVWGEIEISRAKFARLNGIHLTDVRAIIQLIAAKRSGSRVTPGWLTERLGLNSAGTTMLIDRLSDGGHISRMRDGRDRRKIYLELTPEAVAFGESFFRPLLDAALASMESFTDAELATVKRFLDALIDIAVAQKEAPGGTPPALVTKLPDEGRSMLGEVDRKGHASSIRQ